MAPVELHCADLLRRDDWAAADIVWIASVCLSTGTLRAIAARLLESLKPGARVIHMTEHFLRDDDAFERVEEDPILVEMSFGVTGVFVARRRGASASDSRVTRHAIGQAQARGQRRVDGVEA